MAQDINRTLFVHDNIHVLRGIDTASVDLVATDPPFNSKRGFNAPLGSKAAGQRFDDRWRWDEVADEWHDLVGAEHPAVREVVEAAAVIEGGAVDRERRGIDTGPVKNSTAAFLCWMAPRIIEIKRVLKPSGSLYLHCDDAADSYLRLLLDAVFGRSALRNAITWKRQTSNNSGRRCGRIADTILFYAKGEPVWNGGRHKLSDAQLTRYKHEDARGRYLCENLTAARPDSESGKFEWRGAKPGPSRGWAHRIEQLEAWWAEGRIAKKRDGTPRLDGLKCYLDEAEGQPLQNIWTDVPRVGNTGRERSGWATQKPVALYERIIKASSNKGDTVLDPFCGCSTTLLAAERTGRRWAGCDIDPKAEDVVREQMGKLLPDDMLASVAGTLKVRKSPPRRTDIPKTTKGDLRALRWRQQGKRCANPLCTASELRAVDLQLDHRIPRSRGGADDPDNLIGLCGDCNSRKGTKSWGEFMAGEGARHGRELAEARK